MAISPRRPRVLAFLQVWSPAKAAGELGAIRANLRGLGAELVIAADDGAWWLGPDDELRPAAWDELGRFATRPRDRDAVLVLDGAGAIRFSHVADGPGPLTTSLGAALAAAGQALLAPRPPPLTWNRREWVMTCLCTGFATALLGCKRKPSTEPAPPAGPAQPPPPREYDVVLTVNGIDHKLRIDARVTLLDALRERLGLTGTKKGCDHGQCGACTVHVDDRRVTSCLTLAIMAQGKPITTIEGLARGGWLHPVQAAFLEHDGLQCGYCTPGQIMSAVALLAEGRAKTDAEVREQMSGNLCRCGAYPGIVAAIQAARKGA
jgi:xanthine dehydrogenase YagT iron-sulfur-binding subunit